MKWILLLALTLQAGNFCRDFNTTCTAYCFYIPDNQPQWVSEIFQGSSCTGLIIGDVQVRPNYVDSAEIDKSDSLVLDIFSERAVIYYNGDINYLVVNGLTLIYADSASWVPDHISWEKITFAYNPPVEVKPKRQQPIKKQLTKYDYYLLNGRLINESRNNITLPHKYARPNSAYQYR